MATENVMADWTEVRELLTKTLRSYKSSFDVSRPNKGLHGHKVKTLYLVIKGLQRSGKVVYILF